MISSTKQIAGLVGLLLLASLNAGAQVFWGEDFETAFPPSLWTTYDCLPESPVSTMWVDYSTHVSGSGHSHDAAYILPIEFVTACSDNSSSEYHDYDVVLCTPALDVSGVTDPTLTFDFSYRDYTAATPGDLFEVWVSCDDNINQHLKSRYSTSSGPTLANHPLTECAGSSEVVICFRYYSFDPNAWDYYVSLDNVAVTGTAGVMPSPSGATGNSPCGFVPVELQAFTVQ